MITTNLRLIVENILKYGVLTRPQAWVLALVPRSTPLLLLAWVAMAACIFMSWIIENIGCNRLKAERKARLRHADPLFCRMQLVLSAAPELCSLRLTSEAQGIRVDHLHSSRLLHHCFMRNNCLRSCMAPVA